MSSITTKELSALEDQLNSEVTLIKKYKSFASMCSDSTLKTKCEQIAMKHQDHYNKLIKYLG